MKKILVILLAGIMALFMTSCGLEDLIAKFSEGSPSGVTNTKRPELIGTWKLVVEEEDPQDPDQETEPPVDEAPQDLSQETEPPVEDEENDEDSTFSDIDFGMGLEFTEDGKLRYGFDSESMDSIAEGVDTEEILAGMEVLVTIYYDVKSDTELELTVSALLGIKKEKKTVEYFLEGDTLVFDGATYTRVK